MTTSTRTVLRTVRGPQAAMVPSGATVLTPHPRAAAALGRAYRSLAHHAAAQHARHGGRIAPRLRRWRALAEAITAVIPGGDVVALRGTLATPVREALRSGAVDVPAQAGVSATAERALRVARTYRRILAREGRIDPAELFHVAARHPAAREEMIAVVGHAALDAGACAYLDGVAGDGSMVVLPYEEAASARRLAARGWAELTWGPFDTPPGTPGERWAATFVGAQATGDAPEVPGSAGASPPEALGVPTHGDEVREVLARVRELLARGVTGRDIVLTARKPAAWAGLVEDVAWEFGVPVRMDHAVELANTGVGGVIELLREVLRRDAPFEATARLLGHRLLGGWQAERWREARRARPEGVEAWQAFEARASHLAWPREDTREGYRQRFEAFLTAFGLPRDTTSPFDAAAVHLLRRGVADACRPATQSIAVGVFLDDLEDLASLLRVRAAPFGTTREADAVAFVEFHALAGARVAHPFVLGAYEGALPAPVADDPVLDFADRTRLAAHGADLDDAATRARREEAAFAGVVRSAAASLTLTVPSRSDDGPLLPSPYLARLGIEQVATAPPRSPATPEERRRARLQRAAGAPADDPVLAEAQRAWRVEVAREGPGAPDGYDGVTGRAHDPEQTGFSATRIAELGRCPFRWFGRYRLGLEEPEEFEEVITPRLRGLLWHAALEKAGAGAAARLRQAGGLTEAGRPAWDDETLARRFRDEVEAGLPEAYRAAEEDARRPMTEAWSRLRGGEIRALRRLVRSDAFLRPGHVPLAFEAEFTGRWRGLAVRGVVDRIDVGPEGLELIDYKSGSGRPMGAKDASGWGNVDVQLPLYLETAAPALYPEHPARGARYVSVRSAATVATAEPGAEDGALSELAARVRAHLRLGSYPVDPDRRREACRTCDLAAVCRVGPRVDRKRDARDARSGGGREA